MATQSGFLRRGLPRVPGGEPWPPAGDAPERFVSTAAPAAAPNAAPAAADVAQQVTAVSVPVEVPSPGVPAATAAATDAPEAKAGAAGRQLRRGLPRVPGGEPWPPAGEVSLPTVAPADPPVADTVPRPARPVPAPVAPATVAAEEAAPAPLPAPVTPDTAPETTTPGATALRRGLPRVAGGEPWPPAGFAPTVAAPAPGPAPTPAPASAQAPAGVAAPPAAAPAAARIAPAADVVPAQAEPSLTAGAPAPSEAPAAVVEKPETPAAAVVEKAETPKAPAAAVQQPKQPQPKAKLYGSRTLGQWITRAVLLALGAIVAAGILVLAARGVTTLPGAAEFLRRYPGTYELPAAAQPGFPWWAQWTHFLNIFLMVLIIRSGYQVRTQQKPPAYWTPKRGGKKISITLWLHQSLDILWLANGLIFAVLLFSSGHWMRIVPTSWEVFPNAASALLQYMTLSWPVETGWVNYNSLQQLMYFIVVFIAAPIAAVTGARMSEFWPKDAKTLNRIYPVEAARALHFPTMLFFVLFILIHVFLVFATGALRNLNHMFAGTDEVNWVGFWLFAAAIALTAAGWFAARPIVLAPLARLFGKVSSR